MSLSEAEQKKHNRREYYIKNREKEILNAKKNDKKFRSTKEGTIRKLLIAKKAVSKRDNIPFDLDYPFLLSIATDNCPVFNIPFVWESYGRGYRKIDSPSLDRIIPELGYVKGNVAFISNTANTIKQDVTEKELYAVADWLHDKRKEVLNAFRDTAARLPAPPDTPGKRLAARWPFPGAWPWQDRHGTDHHQREQARTDSGDSTQAGGGVGLGPGVSKMATSARAPSGARDGDTGAAFESALHSIRHLRDQRGERPLAGGALARWAVRLFGHRRVKPVQGPQHKTIQGDQEGAKDI